MSIPLEDRNKFALEYLVGVLKVFCPKDTFKLVNNGIVIVNSEYIGIGGENAPYAVYTNEKWEDERWGGKQNPNEGWIQRAIDSAQEFLKQLYSGTISKEDIQSKLNDNANELSKQHHSEADFYDGGVNND